MNTKYVVGICVLTMALAGVWSARAADEAKPAPPRGARAGERSDQVKERLEQISTELKLNEEQKGKIRTVLQRQVDKTRELRADQSLTPEQRREKLMGIRQEIQKEVKGILNEEQFKKWTEIRGQARDGRVPPANRAEEGRRRGPRPGQGSAAPEQNK